MWIYHTVFQFFCEELRLFLSNPALLEGAESKPPFYSKSVMRTRSSSVVDESVLPPLWQNHVMSPCEEF